MKITGFNSSEGLMDFYEQMRKDEEIANASLHPTQAAMRDNTTERQWAYRWEESMQLHIFGEVWSIEESEQAERDCGSTGSELDFTMDGIRNSRTRGYVFGKWYSVYCEEGELGSAHVSNLMPIPQEIFEAARNTGWGPPA